MTRIQTEVGQIVRQANGTFPYAPGGTIGEVLQSKTFPDFYTLNKAGLVYAMALAATNPSAFTGGAAGTPVFGIYNPSNSGKDIVILQARVAVRTPGTTAVSSGYNFWLGVQGSTAPTGTQTQPRNLYTGAAQGSAAYCMSNTANTGAVATNLVAPSLGITAVVTTATQQVTPATDLVNGAIIVVPGNYLAFGIAAALGSGSVDHALIWAETPA